MFESEIKKKKQVHLDVLISIVRYHVKRNIMFGRYTKTYSFVKLNTYKMATISTL